LVKVIIRRTLIYLKETKVGTRQMTQSMREYNIERRRYAMLTYNIYVT
jgi:hypothetical protein